MNLRPKRPGAEATFEGYARGCAPLEVLHNSDDAHSVANKEAKNEVGVCE